MARRLDLSSPVTAFLQDIRFGARQFMRTPSFTAAAVLTLAVGIGATTTVFSFVNAIVLQPLAYEDSDRLVLLVPTAQTNNGPRGTTVTPGDFLDWQAESTSFEHMAAFMGTPLSLTGDGPPERLRGASVSPLLFETLGVAPSMGRSLASVESDRFVVISQGLWSRRFRGDRSIVGRSITLNNEAFTVTGVAPPGFSFPKDLPLGPMRDPRNVDVWMPLALKPGDRSLSFLEVVGRLRSDRTVAQATSEMAAIASRIEGRLARPSNHTLVLEPLHTRVVGDVRPLLYVLSGAGAFVLLIACVNVANLMLARGAERQHEVAVRAALGAGRWRLTRQFMTESLLLGMAGSVLGLLAAVWGVALVSVFVPPGATPRLSEVDIDVSVLAFTFVLALMAPVAFGVLPAVLASRPSAAEALKDAAPTVTSASRLRQLLVAAEIALAFVLVVGAGLLIESFTRLSRVSPGFDADRVLTVSVTLPDSSYRSASEMSAFADDVMARMRMVPGATHVGVVNWLPIGGDRLWGDVLVESPGVMPEGMDITKTAAGGEYFAAMGIPIVRGRGFDGRDAQNAPGVAIVTEGFAQRVWGTADPVGRRVTLGFGREEDQPWVTVVGVAGDIKQTALSAETSPVLYFPPSQAPRPFLLSSLTFVIKTAGEPRDIASSLASHVQRVDPNLPVDRVITMRNLLADSVSTPRFRGVVFASFALAALALVATGIVGVLAYTVARRTREIGLRIALGAERTHVLRLIVRQALAMTAAGLAVGTVAAVALTRLLTSYLYDVTPSDPGAYVAAALVLLALAVGAAYVPARRAANLDPLRALRTE